MTADSRAPMSRPRLLPGLALAFVLALAAFLRLWRLDSHSFTYDAATLSNLADQFVRGGLPPLHGMVSSAGIHNPPLSVYLLALPRLISRDPVVLLAFIALLNVLAVWGCYHLGKRYWSARVGLVAALLCAASPWAIQHSRGILGQNLMAAGIVLFALPSFAWFVAGRRWSLVLAIIALAALVQVHLAAVALAPLVAIPLLIRLAQRRIKPLLAPLVLGIGLGLLLYLPYLIWIAREGAADVAAVTAAWSGTSQWRPEALGHTLLTTGGRNIHSLAGAARFRDFLAGVVNLRYWPDLVEEGLVVVAAVALLVGLAPGLRRRSVRPADGLLLLWLVAPALVFLRSKTAVPPHYLIPAMPAPYLAIGVLCSLASGAIARRAVRLRRPAMLLASVGVLGLVAWQSYVSLSIYRFIDTHDTPSGWGTPVRLLRDVAATVERYTISPNAREVLVLCPGSEPRWEECPAVFSYLLGDVRRVSFVDYNDPALWAHAGDADTLVLLAPGDSRAAADLPAFADPLPQETIALREGAGAYRFYRIHDHFLDAAAWLEGVAGTDDAALLNVAGEAGRFRASYRGGAHVIEFTADPAGASVDVETLLGRRPRVYGIYFTPEQRDPDRMVEGWLEAHAFVTGERWFGPVRVASYLRRGAEAGWPLAAESVEFGEALRASFAVAAAPKLAPGDSLLVRADWEALTAPAAGYAAFVQLLDAQGRFVAGSDAVLRTTDGRGTAEWKPGDRARTVRSLLVPAGSPPGTYRLIAGVYDAANGTRLPTTSGDAVELGEDVVVAAAEAPASLPDMRYPQSHDFGAVALLGNDRDVLPDGSVRLTVWWRLEEQTGTDWQFEARIAAAGNGRGDDSTAIRAPLAGAGNPTTQWHIGEVIRSESVLPPLSPAPAAMRLTLALLDSTGRAAGAPADLGPVQR